MVMEKKRKALGKGLGALLPSSSAENYLQEKSRSFFNCPIERIRPNRYQPRKVFNSSELGDLVSSIRAKGVIQPLIVRSAGHEEYELIAGERRWRAAQKVGLESVPVIVKDVSDQESLELAIIENIQRADLNPVEEAEGYQRLLEEFSYTQLELSEKLGKDRATISNHLRILRLPDDVKKDLSTGAITMGHAKALLSLEDKKVIAKANREIIKKGLSVRATERLAKKLNEEPHAKEKVKARNPDMVNLEKRLTNFFGTKTRIFGQGAKGRLEIDYYSPEDLSRLLELIGL